MWCFRVRLAQADFEEFHSWLDANCPNWLYLTENPSWANTAAIRARLEYTFPPMRPSIRAKTPPLLVRDDATAILMHLRWDVVEYQPYRQPQIVHEVRIKFG